MGFFNWVFQKKEIAEVLKTHSSFKAKSMLSCNKKVKHSLDSSQLVCPELGLLFLALFQEEIKSKSSEKLPCINEDVPFCGVLRLLKLFLIVTKEIAIS